MVRAALLFVLVTSTVVLAAPVPKETPERELIARNWGKTEGKGEFSLTNGRLTIRTGGEPVYDSKLSEQRTLPRTARTLTGDFEITVRLVEASAPDPKAKNDTGVGGTFMSHAGLVVMGGDSRISIILKQDYYTRKGVVDKEPTRRIWVNAWFTHGSIVSLLEQVEEGKPPEFRITRKGDEVTTQHRFGDGKWTAPHTPRVALEFPDEVTVGVFLSHSTFERAHATFDRLVVEKPAAPAGMK